MGDPAQEKGSNASAWIVVDGRYLLNQAREALRTFIAPLNGVYAAATGRETSGVQDDAPSRKTPASA